MNQQYRWLVLVVLVVLTLTSAVRAIEDFNDTLPAEVMEADDKVQIPWAELGSAVREGRGVVEDMATRFALECVLSGDWKCMQVKAVRTFRLWITNRITEDSNTQVSDHEEENKTGGGNGEEGEEDGIDQSTGRLMLDGMTEALFEGVSAIMTNSKEERAAMVFRGSRAFDFVTGQLEEVSGRKKIKKKGLIELKKKLLLLKVAIFTKISTLIHLKQFIVAKVALIISVVKLFMDIKSKSSQSSAPAVIKIIQMSQQPQEEYRHEPQHSHQQDSQQDYGPYAARRTGHTAYIPLYSRNQPARFEQIHY